jgi:hypothetical protein
MNNNVYELLQKLKDLLVLEKEYIIKAINDPNITEEINKVVLQKQSILSQIATFNPKDFEEFKDLIIQIQQLSRNNMILAESNLKFIESIFDSIFEESSTYSLEGQIKKQPSSILNKKV